MKQINLSKLTDEELDILREQLNQELFNRAFKSVSHN